MKNILSAFIVTFIFSTSLTAQTDKTEQNEMSSIQYIGGGVTGTFVGFGLGHAIQGRWMSKGWLFTVNDLVVMPLAAIMLFAVGMGGNNVVTAAGVVVFYGSIGIRIWETADVWLAPVHKNGKIYGANDSFLAIVPLLAVGDNRKNLGLGLKYTF